MNCEKTSRMMTDLLAGELTDQEKSELEAHLASCKACRNEFEQLKEAWSLAESALKADSLGENTEKSGHEEIFRKASSVKKGIEKSRLLEFRWLEIAAGITLCAVVAAIFLPEYLKNSRIAANRTAEHSRSNEKQSDKIKAAPARILAPAQEMQKKEIGPSMPASAPAPFASAPTKPAERSKDLDRSVVSTAIPKVQYAERDESRLLQEKTANDKPNAAAAKLEKKKIAGIAAAKSDNAATGAIQPEAGEFPTVAESTPSKMPATAGKASPGVQMARAPADIRTSFAKDSATAKSEAVAADAGPKTEAEKERTDEPVLDARQQLMLKRVIELLKESKHWPGYPLKSVRFDGKRKQWEFNFNDMKPDSGICAYIKDENSDEIDILLFPPTWTKYRRK